MRDHREERVGDHAEDQRRHGRREAAHRSREHQLPAPLLLVGAPVPRGEEDVHQPDRHREERERLEVHGRAERVAVRDAAQREQGRGRERDRQDLGAAVDVAVLLDDRCRRDREQERGAEDPDRQGDPVAPDLLQQDAEHVTPPADASTRSP